MMCECFYQAELAAGKSVPPSFLMAGKFRPLKAWEYARLRSLHSAFQFEHQNVHFKWLTINPWSPSWLASELPGILCEPKDMLTCSYGACRATGEAVVYVAWWKWIKSFFKG
jgi:hypothetical protein